jgi:1-acyl-sn-glycerol-3-phosphate acyltransferase
MGKVRRTFVSPVLRGLISTLCKVDLGDYLKALDTYMGKVPLVVAFNHINFLEVPAVVAYSNPRQVTGIVEANAWGNPMKSFLFNTYDAIPLNREGAYLHTFRQVHNLIKQGWVVCIAPEGTRSKTGVLGQGKAGIVQLAYISGAAILPLAHFGGENFWPNIKHLKRTPFHMRVGTPFRFKFDTKPDGSYRKPSKELQEEMTSEMMGQIAAMLPENMRGPYSEEALKEPQYLEFIR